MKLGLAQVFVLEFLIDLDRNDKRLRLLKVSGGRNVYSGASRISHIVDIWGFLRV